jgi:hypothetical protein
MLSDSTFKVMSLCFKNSYWTGHALFQWDANERRLSLCTERLPRICNSISSILRILHFCYTCFRSLQFISNGGSVAYFILQLLFVSQNCLSLFILFNTEFRGEVICDLINKVIELDMQLSGMLCIYIDLYTITNLLPYMLDKSLLHSFYH